MAVQGSWWEYNDGLVLDVPALSSVSTYTLDKEMYGCKYLTKNVDYAPVHPLFGYIDSVFSIESNNDKYWIKYRPILGKQEGVFYSKTEPGNNSYAKYERSVLAKYDSLEIQGNMYYNLIKVQHYKEIKFHKGFTYIEIKKYTLAKNIGVVRYEYPMQSIDIELVDYHIQE